MAQFLGGTSELSISRFPSSAAILETETKQKQFAFFLQCMKDSVCGVSNFVEKS
ncbi:rCG22487 [Rattus norvegicus]|uniref:RCG22487 n=1 Tax=Rattus norvegicus TaxID=10116 RepID=A6INX1_RAT|nr:rCG22487 [Rattus norvegicus]